MSYSSVKRDTCLVSHIACPFVLTLRLPGTSTHQSSRMSFGSLPLWSHVRAKICGRCTPRLYPGHITVLQNGTEPLAHLSPSFSTSPSCPLEAHFSELKVLKAAGEDLTDRGRRLTGVDKRASPLKSRRRGVRVWPVCPHPPPQVTCCGVAPPWAS